MRLLSLSQPSRLKEGGKIRSTPFSPVVPVAPVPVWPVAPVAPDAQPGTSVNGVDSMLRAFLMDVKSHPVTFFALLT